MSSLRISGGTLRGRRIELPRGHELRPTSDRARQAFFNMIAAESPGSDFLDLFAGSGVFSFEALSRGARSATAVELSRTAADHIRASARALTVDVDVFSGDVFTIVPRMKERAFSVVYADPPYGFERYEELLTLLDDAPAISNGAVVAVEHPSRGEQLSTERRRLRFRKHAAYGTVAISLFDREDG